MRTLIARRRSSGGFTLLEVLVALLILAIVLAALVRSVGLEARALGAQRDTTVAMWVAANRIASIRLASGPAPIGRSVGTDHMARRDWVWRSEVSTTDVAGIRRISVAVYDSEQATDPVVRLDGFDDGKSP